MRNDVDGRGGVVHAENRPRHAAMVIDKSVTENRFDLHSSDSEKNTEKVALSEAEYVYICGY